MFRDQPAPREPHYTLRVRLPSSIVAELNQRTEARASPIETLTTARDALVAELLADALERRRTLQPVAPTPSTFERRSTRL